MKSQLYIIPEDVKKIAVFGDIHGCPIVAESLKPIVRSLVEEGYFVIFLGDYVDRGPCSVEVIKEVLEVLEEYPESIVALRGNHEDFQGKDPESVKASIYWAPCTVVDEAEYKGGWDTFCTDYLIPLLERLYLAALYRPSEKGPGILFLHGGVSSRIKGIKDLREPSRKVAIDILWSDPFEGLGEWPNPRGCGVLFGRDITSAVLNAIGADFIVRSHEPRKARTSPCFEHGNKVVTVASTTVYGGKFYVTLIEPIFGSPKAEFKVLRI